MRGVSINELSTYRWSFEEDVTRYAAAGVQAIGVWRQKLSDYGEEKGGELLREHGMSVSNLLWAGGFTGGDGRTFCESLEDAVEAVRLAADLESDCLVVYSGGRGGHTGNHARRLFKAALAELAPLASDLGVRLAVEPMHESCARDWTFLTDVDETLEIIEDVDPVSVGLVFDSYHLGQQRSILDRVEELVPYLAVVHVGDCKRPLDGEQNRCPLGEGQIPLREILAALKSSGYGGYFDIELIGAEIEVADYDRLIVESKAICEQLVQMACA
ncbi:MAG: sugar phosphate isomerase/epimerase [Planctomycetota bacterium]|nr:MAG: sugar phosphate isomerase/epimerase [Planctomycetota bacterium]REJ93672.1 MAG: sugar phosphate isomerase/epimerase [Planctomycetota bacterium]REK25721.1 MAG: sugar phosphate isomerase/epimerase [Planctomycetota bacterium]REK46533.1 MAG: sugar phosphate isomerase/epimerase [Planctomycetota bacterium]